ncbi:MAG: ABC transporter permease subunit [Oligoflexia bacterium]|nr:ABC transporter permease subunit [Oligoflexia bacterium]
MLYGSVVLSTLAILVAYPIALGVCALVNGIAPSSIAKILKNAIHYMTSIPTVIYGFISVIILVPLVRNLFRSGSGYCLLTTVLTLSVVILPTIILIINLQIEKIPPSIRIGCRAIGMSPASEMLWIIFPAVRNALIDAFILGFARANGDTLIALMVSGNSPQIPKNLFDSFRTLPAHIGIAISTDTQTVIYQSIFLSGLILVLVTILVTILVNILVNILANTISRLKILPLYKHKNDRHW